MKEMVKTELETYSSVTSQGTASVVSLATSTAQLRKVEEEERSRNVIVFWTERGE